MTKKTFATLIPILFLGALLALSNTGYSSDDDSSDGSHDSDSSDKKDPRLSFAAKATGAQEVGAVMTDGTGRVEARFDAGFTRVSVRLRVGGLSGDVDAAHFHCARPGVNGPVAFGFINPGPCVLNDGRLSCTFGNENFTGADCEPTAGRPVSNIAALPLAMRDGLIYTNVHTMNNPGGEVRGQMLEK